MKYCPSCLKQFPDDATHCDTDGQGLVQNGVALSQVESPGIHTLSELLRQQSPLPVETAVNFISAICDIVEQTTGKPSDFFDTRHVLLKKDLQLDGEAFAAEIRRQTAATDKPNLDEVASYIAPEIVQQQETSAASAVYSLGAILYEMLTGQPPFSASSVAAIAIKQILESPRPPRELREEISEPLQKVILRALSKEPSSRQPSLREFKQELQTALRQATSTTQLADKPIMASRPSMPPPTQLATGYLDDAYETMAGSASPPQSDEQSEPPTEAISEPLPPLHAVPAAPPPPVSQSAPSAPQMPPSQASPPQVSPDFQTRTVIEDMAISSPQVYGNYSARPSYAPSASYPVAAPKSSKKIYVIAALCMLLFVVAAVAFLFTFSKSSSTPTLTNTTPTTPANRNASTTPLPPQDEIPPKNRNASMNRNASVTPPSPAPPVQPPTTVSKQNSAVLFVLIGVVILGATGAIIFVILLRRKTQSEVRVSPPQIQSPPKPLPQTQTPKLQSSEMQSRRCMVCKAMVPPEYAFCQECGTALSGKAIPFDTSVSFSPESSVLKSGAAGSISQSPTQPIVKSETDLEKTQKRARVDAAPSQERLKVCSACHTEFPVSVKFCVHDGTTLQEKTKPVPPKKDPSFYDLQTLDNRKRCPQCSAEYPEDKKFCRKDGSRLVLIPPGEATTKAMEEIEPFMIAQYQCFARLGEGGMGLVYKARDIDLKRLAAVKVLLPKTKNLDEAARLFRREAQLASSINHPNIVTIYSCGETNIKLLYMAMEFIEGKSLADILKAQRSSAQLFPLPKVLHITRSICDALDAAHERGIIHRDLKPQNVMVCPRANRPDIVKVVDFGIARSLVSQEGYETIGGSIVGTPMYMSPEQARGEFDIDERSDVFSLAIMVYQMVSGKLPFTGEEKNTLQVLSRRARLQDAPPPLKTIRTDLNLPDALDSVMTRALEPDKNRRTRSAMQFIEQFEQAARVAI